MKKKLPKHPTRKVVTFDVRELAGFRTHGNICGFRVGKFATVHHNPHGPVFVRSRLHPRLR